jgi:hypothetical protein
MKYTLRNSKGRFVKPSFRGKVKVYNERGARVYGKRAVAALKVVAANAREERKRKAPPKPLPARRAPGPRISSSRDGLSDYRKGSPFGYFLEPMGKAPKRSYVEAFALVSVVIPRDHASSGRFKTRRAVVPIRLPIGTRAQVEKAAQAEAERGAKNKGFTAPEVIGVYKLRGDAFTKKGIALRSKIAKRHIKQKDKPRRKGKRARK